MKGSNMEKANKPTLTQEQYKALEQEKSDMQLLLMQTRDDAIAYLEAAVETLMSSANSTTKEKLNKAIDHTEEIVTEPRSIVLPSPEEDLQAKRAEWRERYATAHKLIENCEVEMFAEEENLVEA